MTRKKKNNIPDGRVEKQEEVIVDGKLVWIDGSTTLSNGVIAKNVKGKRSKA